MPHWLVKGCIVSVGVLLAFPASAQDGQQILNFFLNQATQELDRQQRIEQQRQQQLYEIFSANWYACGAGDLGACDEALTYPQLSSKDRRALKRQRAALLEAKRQSIALEQEQARQAERERQEREETARREAELAAERERQAEAARIEQAHQDELARQKAEVERLEQQRLAEERRLAEMRAFADLREACRAYDSHACTTALASSLATAEDKTDLALWRRTAEQLDADLATCAVEKSATACDAALASPALKPTRRPEVAGWRAKASPLRIAYASIMRQSSRVMTAVAELPVSTQFTSALAALLALIVVLQMRGAAPAGHNAAGSDALRRWRDRLRSSVQAFRRTAEAPTPAAEPTAAGGSQEQAGPPPAPAAPPVPDDPPPAPVAKVQLPAVIAPRDTPAAIAAMQLANAYIEQVIAQGEPDYEDKAGIKQRLNTLSLAAKQLAAAESCDPDAVLEVAEVDGTLRWRIHELKSRALRLEGITHTDPRKSRAALLAATEADPENATAFYTLGLFHAGERNRAAAVDAFRCAVALQPQDIEFRMELDRAENMSGGEIAGFKLTRAGIKTYNAGIHTLNFFIICRNIFAVIWNVFAFTWNVVTFPLRLMQRILGLFG